MRLPGGIEVVRFAGDRGAGFAVVRRKHMQTVSSRGGWWPLIREPFAGAWQRNRELRADSVLAHHAVYTCITLIASDIGKLRPKLVELDADGIWSEVRRESPYLIPLRRPNRYQNRIQFIQWWITSKLTHGNTYVLKERDDRNIVRALYILDPSRVTVMVTENGEVFYQLSDDNLSNVQDRVAAPASEIIHDRMNCLFHPLVGVPPIFASGMAAHVGLTIEQNAEAFFANGSNPSGILTAPAHIPQATADRIKDTWDKNYSGENSGRIAVLGDGLKFEAMRMSAVDAQMIEHLKWTAETVCNTFHVPHFKAGVGTQPTYQNGEVLNGVYYSDCLQSHIESFELCMDEGLGLDAKVDGRWMGVELDLDGLLRMDHGAQMDTLTKGVRGGVLTPNGARKKLDEKPLEGGDTIYLQHQDYPMEKVFRRTDLDPAPKPDPAPPPPDDDDDEEDEGETRSVAFWTQRIANVERVAA